MNYWVSRGGQQYGPYSLADLQKYVASGNILPTDLARSESMSQWLPVSQILAGGGQAPQPAAPQPAAPQPQQPQQPQPQPYLQPQQPYGQQPQPYAQPVYSQPAGAMPAQAYVPAPMGGQYASWGNRVVGYLIDSAFVLVVMAGLGVLAGSLGFLASSASSRLGGSMCCVMLPIFVLATLLVGVYNKVYLISTRGCSIGQGIMKLRVCDANGANLTMGTAGLRLLAQVGMGMVPLLSFVDLLFPLWDERRQTLHDKVVSSYVITNASAA